MGKINLTPLRVRSRALADLQAGRYSQPPVWLDVVGDIPPAQILTRQQPNKHAVSQIRTRTLLSGKTEQYTIAAPSRKPKSAKPSRLFAPVEIKYEEDQFRKQFFQDHPWELARPRVVVETNGNQHAQSDYSKGLVQPNVPLSGESVVQRQRYLVENTPDMTVDQAYDIARKEFYILRRQQAIKQRVAREEAQHNGMKLEKSILQWSMAIENKQYDNWEKWSREQVMDLMQRNAAFSGEVAPRAEEARLSGREGTEAADSPWNIERERTSNVLRG